jgi:NDP-sugar pyrophosphorylase family protein
MINIVLPIAGRGSRFVEKGYTLPKPLIPVHGVPMIEVVVNNIKPNREHQFTFLVLKEHLDKFDMEKTLKRVAPGCNIITVDQVTEGAACTVLLARDIINNDDELMLANSDQWVDININDYLESYAAPECSGLIMTMWADHPKWSYVGFDKDGSIDRVVEKEVISNEATVGIYNFKKGSDFVSAAEEMIAVDDRVNNEFYVAPAYNYLIKRGAKLGIYNVGKEYDGMYGMGIPSDLELFMENPVSKKSIDK